MQECCLALAPFFGIPAAAGDANTMLEPRFVIVGLSSIADVAQML